MNERDLELIEEMLTRKLDEKLDEKLDKKLDEHTRNLTRDLTTSLTRDLTRDLTHTMEGLIEASERRTGVLLERLEQKVDVVIEGQQALVERMDRLEVRQKDDYEKLDKRITTLAADLVEHKSDPIAHHRGFSIKEEEEKFEP